MSSEQPSTHFPGEAGWWSFGCDNGRELSFTIHHPFIKGKWEELRKVLDKGSRVKGGHELHFPGKGEAWPHLLQRSPLLRKSWGRAVKGIDQGCMCGLGASHWLSLWGPALSRFFRGPFPSEAKWLQKGSLAPGLKEGPTLHPVIPLPPDCVPASSCRQGMMGAALSHCSGGLVVTALLLIRRLYWRASW